MHPGIPDYMFDIFTAATALGVVMQACILLGMFLVLRKLQKKVEGVLDQVTQHAMPLLSSSRTTLEEIGPKLKVISSNLVDISETLKVESHNIKGSVDEVLERTRLQTARVDEMVSGTLDGITHAGVAIQHGISVPLRQLNGLLNGVKAGLGVLRKNNSRVPRQHVNPMATTAAEPEVIVIVEETVAAATSNRL